MVKGLPTALIAVVACLLWLPLASAQEPTEEKHLEGGLEGNEDYIWVQIVFRVNWYAVTSFGAMHKSELERLLNGEARGMIKLEQASNFYPQRIDVRIKGRFDHMGTIYMRADRVIYMCELDEAFAASLVRRWESDVSALRQD